MFARIVRATLKPGAGKAFASTMEHEVIPAIKKFHGFAGEIGLVSSDGKEAIGISLWEHREDAEAYNRSGASEVLKMMGKHLEGKTELRTYDVTNSTVQKLHVDKAA